MNPEIKVRWIEALRSGQFKQGRGVLHRVENGNHTYCCLGVLCEIAKDDLTDMVVDYPGYQSESKSMGGEGAVDYDGALTTLPHSVVEWAELESDCPIIYPSGGRSLAVLNDGYALGTDGFVAGKSFNEIADLIEQEL